MSVKRVVWVGMLVSLVPMSRASGQPHEMGTAFTYQGQLMDDGSPADGLYDFEFKLCDDPVAACTLATITAEDEQVDEGLFTVEIDFGADVFNGQARWLEMGVRPGASVDPYTTLTPRQELTPTAHALALPGLWTQQNANSPNVIGGSSANSVAGFVYGATIGGGGDASYPNSVLGNYGTVGGGKSNAASGDSATVGGGAYHTASGDLATVGGGADNTASGSIATVGGGATNTASVYAATVGGGDWNTASGDSATVGGGVGNTASGAYATVPGGAFNTAEGDYSLAGGQRAQANHQGSFVWSDSTTEDPDYFSSTGDDQFLINAAGGVGIGKNDPSAQLDVEGNIHASGTITSGSSITIDGTSGSESINSAGDLDLQTGGTSRVFIENTGDVGIGTDTPVADLHVKGLAAFGTGARDFRILEVSPGDTQGWASLLAYEGIGIGSDTGTNRQMTMFTDGAGADRIFTVATSTNWGSNWNERLTVLQNGRVGIMRKPTANSFEVEGNASKTAAGDWLANSDRRIKTEIKTVDGALEKLDKVRLVSFDYTDAYRARHAGVEARRYLKVIAQEFAEVFPEYVKGSGEHLPDGEEILQVDSYPLTIYSAAAIQELHKIAKEKDAQIATQQQQIAELAARLAALEKLVKQANAGQEGGGR